MKVNEMIDKELEEERLMLDKVTPKYDLSWYVKWCSSLLVLIGMLLTVLTYIHII